MADGVNLLASFINHSEPAGEGDGKEALTQKENQGKGTGAKSGKKTKDRATQRSVTETPRKTVQEKRNEGTPETVPAKRGRKKVEDPENLTQISIRITKDLYRRIRLYLAVADEKENMTKLVREALEEYLDEHGG